LLSSNLKSLIEKYLNNFYPVLSDEMSDDGGMMDEKRVDELLQKMHEKKGNTVEYLQKSFSDDELERLNKQISNEIHVKSSLIQSEIEK